MTMQCTKPFIGAFAVLLLGLGCCPANRSSDSLISQPKTSGQPKQRCWQDTSVLNVRRIFPSSLLNGEIALLEVLVGSCKPTFEPDQNWPFPVPKFNWFYKCKSNQTRLVYRDPHTGRLVRTLTATLPTSEVVDDVRGLRYTTLAPGVRAIDAPLLRHGPLRTADDVIHYGKFPMGQVAKIWKEGKLLRTIRSVGNERITCAKLIPGSDLVAICFTTAVTPKTVRVTNSEDRYVGRSVYDERLKPSGFVRLYRVRDGKQISSAKFQYLPTMRATGPCAVVAMVPQGLYDSDSDGKANCAAYSRACQEKEFSQPCGDKWYKKRLPRAYDLTASPSPNGDYLAILAFDDLLIYKVKKPRVGLQLVRKHSSATYYNRDFHLSDARLRWSSGGTVLALFGEGRIVRLYPLRGKRVLNIKVRGRNLCRTVMCEPLVGSVFVDEHRKLLVYSRPDFSIGINWLKMALRLPGFYEGVNMTTLNRHRLFATLPKCSHCGRSLGHWARDIVVVGNTMIFNAGGVLFKVALDSGITKCSMGVRTADGYIVRW